MATVNGKSINLKPSKGMVAEAKRFLQWRKEGHKGGTDTAYRRARQIINNPELSADVVIAMRAWKARHLVDRKAEGWARGSKGYPSKGRVAAAAWGLPAGDGWVDEKGGMIEKARKLEVDRSTPCMESLQFEIPADFAEGKIDKEKGIIYGVSVISTPEAKGHGIKIDRATIESFAAAVEGKTVKAYYTHDDDNEALDTIGIWKNFQIVEAGEFVKLTADFEALESWREHHSSQFDALFEMAEKAPEAFGVSAEFTARQVFYEEGEEKEYSGQEEVDEVFARAVEVQAFSIVAQPAANPTGLFSVDAKVVDADEIDQEEFLEFNLKEATQSLAELREDLGQANAANKVFEEKLAEQESELVELKEKLKASQDETKTWQAKYGQLTSEMGSEPVEVQSEVALSIEDKIAQAESWTEKAKLFKENMATLNKSWAK
jgi:DNA-binding transcriptional MerR regulator